MIGVTGTMTGGDAGSAATRKEVALDRQRAMDRFLADVERRALRIAELQVRDAEAALDIVQDAMIRLVRRYAARPAEEWRPLFFRILSNRIRDHQRREGVRRRLFGWANPDPDAPDPVAEAPDGDGARPDHRAVQAAAMAALDAALAELPARQREAFLLRSLEGLDVAATAAAMGCSDGSVKTHYSRAVHRLRGMLGEHWHD